MSRSVLLLSGVLSVSAIASSANAAILIDDLSSRDATKYPAGASRGLPATIEETGLASAIGGYRLNFISAGPRIQDGPNVTPIPSATLDWNAGGSLTYAANTTSTSTWFVGWAKPPALGGPLNVDVTGETFLSVTYSSTSDITFMVNFGNTSSTGANTGGNDAEFTLPAGVNRTQLIPIANVNTPESALPGAPIPPPVDLTSLDSVLLELRTGNLGDTITLDSVSFTAVPEPGSIGAICLAGALLATRRRRR